MLSPTTIWIAFALYMCFLLGVAVYVTVQDKKKAAGGSLLTASVKWPVLVMTYIASLMSTWVFFAGPGAYYRGGLGYWISEMSYIALFPIIAHFTMNKVWIINREMGGTFSTPADFYDARFKSCALRSRTLPRCSWPSPTPRSTLPTARSTTVSRSSSLALS